jgi:YHS domain-containing protein
LAEEAGMNMPLSVNEVDLVCGTVLNSVAVVETSMLEGKAYGFCSKSCKETFEGNPKKYIEHPAPRKENPRPTEQPEEPAAPKVDPGPMKPPL